MGRRGIVWKTPDTEICILCFLSFASPGAWNDCKIFMRRTIWNLERINYFMAVTTIRNSG